MKPALIALAALSIVACSSPEAAPAGASSASTATATQATAGATATGAHHALSVEVSESRCSARSDGAMPVAMRATRSGSDVTVEVTDYQTYCSSDVTYAVVDEGGTVRITASKPSAVSRCVCPHRLTLTVHGVTAGEHRVVLDAMPYASDATVATTIAEARVSMR